MARGEPDTIDLEALLGSSRSTLLAATHELKAPLSLIRMYASRLENGELTYLERQKYAARILFTAEQMLQLTSGLLESHRWMEGQLPLEPVNTKIICEEVLHELTPAARELDQNLTLMNSQPQANAVGNAQMLKNVIFNIVFNACKHTPAGSDVTLGAARRGGRVHVSVVDTGPGFGKEIITHINRGADGRFQASPNRPGSGLGLAVAKQLLTAMNGTLQLKASPKGGYCVVSLQASRQMSLSL